MKKRSISLPVEFIVIVILAVSVLFLYLVFTNRTVTDIIPSISKTSETSSKGVEEQTMYIKCQSVESRARDIIISDKDSACGDACSGSSIKSVDINNCWINTDKDEVECEITCWCSNNNAYLRYTHISCLDSSIIDSTPNP